MAANKVFGDLTAAVSSAAELLSDADVAHHGAPNDASALGYHTPQRAKQNYTDVDTGNEWTWWAGTWTHQ